MTTCFGYVRVSTQKQGDGASLAAQKDAITGFASQNGLVVSQWFEELETASKRGRPIYDDMMRKLKAGKAEGVVVHRWDRTARNFSDWARLSELADQGIKVFCAGDNIDFNSRSGRLMADIQMVFATDYSRNLSIEVKKGQAQRLKEGYWPWRAPLGYVDNGKGELKTPCPKKAPLVKQAFRLYLSGEYSITSLTEEMQRRGLTNFYGERLARRHIERMLNNPYYCGVLTCRQGTYDGIHKTLISVADFRAVQRIKENRYAKKVTRHDHAFRGMFTCGVCNRALIGERQKAHVYYRCHTQACPEKSYREDRLEEQVEKALAEFEWSPEQVKAYRQDLQARDLFAEQDALLASLNLRAAEIQTRQSRLTDLYLDGNVTESEFTMRKQQLKLDLGAIDEERNQLGRAKDGKRDIETLLGFVSSITSVFDAASPSERRQLLKTVFVERRVLDGECKLITADFDNLAETVTKPSVPASLSRPVL